ncbi:MAG: CBS domain-containing protein [Candidatus Pacearchaeota archaeon]|nr:CBS domain-containing protein [Candidatus Pacearchaeota archaeon]
MKVYGIKVGDIMTRNFVFASPSTSIEECVKIMAKKKVGSLIIKEGQNLKGIVTEGDIIRAIAKGIKLKEKVKKIMTSRLITIKPSADILKASKIMKKKKIRWLPVTIGKKVVGLITMKDLLKIQPALKDILLHNIKIAEEEEKMKRTMTNNEMKWEREGPCYECGVYDLLYKVGGRFICENCKKKLNQAKNL